MSTLKATNLVHPSSSSNNIVLDNSGNVEARKVNGCQRIILEQFFSPCDGSVIALQDGNHTLENVTATQFGTDSWVKLNGSEITYTPPTGTTQVIYEFHFMDSYDHETSWSSHKFQIDGTDVAYNRIMNGSNDHSAQYVVAKLGINIGGDADANVGRQASWSSAKTIKIMSTEYNSSNGSKWHNATNWAQSSTDQFSIPSIGITAIG